MRTRSATSSAHCRTSLARERPNRCGYSHVALRIRKATGFRSSAYESHPRRRASSGIAPPPAKQSRTRGVDRLGLSLICLRACLSTFADAPHWHSSLMKPSCSSRSSADAGAGTKAEKSAARQATSGRRARHGCRVEMCPFVLGSPEASAAQPTYRKVVFDQASISSFHSDSSR